MWQRCNRSIELFAILLFAGKNVLSSEAFITSFPRRQSSKSFTTTRCPFRSSITCKTAKDAFNTEGLLDEIDVLVESIDKPEKKRNVRTATKRAIAGKESSQESNGMVKPKAKNSRKKKKIKLSEERRYWMEECDEFRLEEMNSGSSPSNTTANDGDACESQSGTGVSGEASSVQYKSIRFTVRGKPIPLSRHRTAKGFMYNPSASAQEAFRQVASKNGDFEDDIMAQPLFGAEKYIAMTILFRLKRPQSHFVGNKPGPGRLRPSAPQRLNPSRTDVDNLAKFVLDSLNKLLYVDDRQVVSLHAAKVLDTEGHCEGATEVCIQCLDEGDMTEFLRRSFDTNT